MAIKFIHSAFDWRHQTESPSRWRYGFGHYLAELWRGVYTKIIEIRMQTAQREISRHKERLWILPPRD